MPEKIQSLSDMTTPPRAQMRVGRGMNWLGLWTLYTKEVKRFWRVGPQTLLAPVVSNLLYLTVFVLAFSENRVGGSEGFIGFLIPGLIMLGIINNSSANSSSSLMTGKMMGSIIDVLMPPLSHVELTLGFLSGAATRGVLVAVFTAIVLSVFGPLWPDHWWAVLYFGLSAAMMMGMVGLLSGVWAEKFDQLAVVNQFIILPLSFLSGTFYRIDVLPEIWQKIIQWNPLFYLIDGFRYGFTGVADSNIQTGVILAAVLNVLLFITCLKVLKSGWRLKS